MTASPETRVLLVEDEAQQRRLMSDILTAQGYAVCPVGSLAAATAKLAVSPFDIVLSDWKLPDGSGAQVLERSKSMAPDCAVIIITAYGTVANAVAAVRAGADDYLTKPLERQALLLAIKRSLKTRQLEGENRRLSEEIGERDRLVNIIGKVPSMQRLYRRVEKVADTRATVLISGESGTGKELVARALHALSGRSAGAFVAVNCAAIPEGLIEAEFFGAEKGAYTGATASRAGKFAAARGGTLFLDELGELPLALQPKLLRVLQEGRYTTVGGTREIETDARIIAATNRDLARGVTAGEFREDLYYRLNVVPIEVPPLRERREDIPRLIEHFVRRALRAHELTKVDLPKSVLRRLLDYTWPGNVRELSNVIERLVLLAEDNRASVHDLPQDFNRHLGTVQGFELPPSGLDWNRHENEVLRQSLALTGGNRSRAAQLLQLSYKTFLYRLKKHGIHL